MREHKRFDSEQVFLSSGIDQPIVTVTKLIQGLVNAAISEGAEKVEVNWINEYDKEKNPNRSMGFFRVLGFRNEESPNRGAIQFIPNSTKGAYGPIAPEDESAFAAATENASGECLSRVEVEAAKDKEG